MLDLHQLCLREITPNDIEVVHRLHDICFPVKYTNSFYNELLDHNRMVTVVASLSEDIIGVGTARLNGYIATLGIEPSFRRQGLGRIILTKLIAILRNTGTPPPHLHVKSDNIAAIELYCNLGFTIESVIPDHYMFHGATHDALLLVLDHSTPIFGHDTDSVYIDMLPIIPHSTTLLDLCALL